MPPSGGFRQRPEFEHVSRAGEVGSGHGSIGETSLDDGMLGIGHIPAADVLEKRQQGSGQRVSGPGCLCGEDEDKRLAFVEALRDLTSLALCEPKIAIGSGDRGATVRVAAVDIPVSASCRV